MAASDCQICTWKWSELSAIIHRIVLIIKFREIRNEFGMLLWLSMNAHCPWCPPSDACHACVIYGENIFDRRTIFNMRLYCLVLQCSMLNAHADTVCVCALWIRIHFRLYCVLSSPSTASTLLKKDEGMQGLFIEIANVVDFDFFFSSNNLISIE